MAKTTAVAAQVSAVLLDGFASVMENRIDDITNQYLRLTQRAAPEPATAAAAPPVAEPAGAGPAGAGPEGAHGAAQRPRPVADPKFMRARRQVEHWAALDPTTNKKYLAWIVQQIANQSLMLPDFEMQLEDDLKAFERILRIPAYQGNRDIYQFPTYPAFHDHITQSGTIRSQTDLERERRSRERERRERIAKGTSDLGPGVTKVAEAGNLTLLKITSVESLMTWSWRAYDPAKNPNWPEAKVAPKFTATGMEVNLGDGLWCTRFDQYANSRASEKSPFYLVLKNGGPYAGIIFDQGEMQDLWNNKKQPDHQMRGAQLEEIYPVLKDVIPPDTTFRGRCGKLALMRFLHGDVKDGETVQGPIDLSGTSLKSLPNNLTVKGGLDISKTPITHLPHGLKVEGDLDIRGTQIADLPDDLSEGTKGFGMEWSEPLDWPKVKRFFYLRRRDEMENKFYVHAKIEKASPEEKSKAWAAFQPRLLSHFLHSPDVDKHVVTVYRYTPAPTAPPPAKKKKKARAAQ